MKEGGRAAAQQPAVLSGAPLRPAGPSGTCWGRGGSWRGCAAFPRSSGRSLPCRPSSLPRLPQRPEAAPAACAARSAGRRRRRRRPEQLPALGAKQNNSSEHWAPSAGRHTCPKSRVFR